MLSLTPLTYMLGGKKGLGVKSKSEQSPLSGGIMGVSFVLYFRIFFIMLTYDFHDQKKRLCKEGRS